jgi:(2R)-3-sulfolactate dehydrogenase (NADP+)
MARFTLQAVEEMAYAALLRRTASDGNARSVATSILRAEADGIRSVGLGYLPTYLGHLTTGKVDGNVVAAVTVPRPSTILVDARHGFAHPAFDACTSATFVTTLVA